MSRLQESYQGIREQLVSLSVELDDRTKFIDILETKVEEERDILSRIEADVSDEYNSKMEAEIISHRDKLKELQESANTGVVAKKSLLEKCKAIVEKLKQKDDKLKSDLRKLTAAANHDIEVERKTFRAGQEERQRKFMSARLQEEVQSTERALEPEFSRLRIAHEQEVADLELQLSREERRAKDELRKLFEDKQAAEERSHKESLRTGARSRMDNVLRETESMEKEHAVRVERITAELSAELEKYKSHLARKLEMDVQESEGTLAAGEKRYREKLHSIRHRHEAEIRALEKEHAAKTKELRAEFRRRQDDHERHLLQTSGVDGGRGGEGDEGGQQQLFVERVCRELTEARDKQIKAEIRRLQTEAVTLERELKQRNAEETRRVEEAVQIEEEQLRTKEASQTNEIAELSAEKTEVSRLLREAVDGLGDIQEELAETRSRTREAAEVQDTLMEKHKEISKRFNERLSHIESSYNAKLQSLREKASTSREAFQREKRQFRSSMQNLENAHEDRLNAINAEVKNDLARKDEELDTLRDVVQTEKVKLAKLKKLLSRYS